MTDLLRENSPDDTYEYNPPETRLYFVERGRSVVYVQAPSAREIKRRKEVLAKVGTVLQGSKEDAVVTEELEDLFDWVRYKYESGNQSKNFLLKTLLSAKSVGWEETERMARECLGRYPADDVIRQVASECLPEREAIPIWQDLADKKNTRAVSRLAQYWIQKGKMREAIETIESIGEEALLDWRLLTLSATLHLWQGDYPLSIRRYRAALEDRPSLINARRNLALAHYLSGDVGSAVRALVTSLRIDSLDDRSLKFLLEIAQDASPHEAGRVLAIARKYLAIRPSDTEVANGAAYLCLRVGMYDDGIHILQDVRQHNRAGLILGNLGALYWKKHNLPIARRYFVDAMTTETNSISQAYHVSLIGLLGVLLEEGKLKEIYAIAEEALNQFKGMDIGADKVLWKVPAIYTHALYRDGKVKQAITMALEYFEKPTRRPEVIATLGTLLSYHYCVTERNLDMALRYAKQSYEVITQVDDDLVAQWHMIVANNLAYGYLEVGDIVSAESVLRDVPIESASYPFLKATRGFLAFRKGHLKKGEAYYRLAIKLSTDMLDKRVFRQKMYFEIGKSHFSAGNYRNAERAFEKVVGIGPISRPMPIMYIVKEAAEYITNIRAAARRLK